MKKTLALILALSLVLGAMSGIAFAAEVVVTDEAGLLAAVANDGEITLGGNITLSGTVVIPENITVVLDLKGYAITMEDSIKTTTYAFNNLGNLTIKDTVGGGSVSSRGIYNGYGNGADNVEDAVITILSGTYNALGTNGGAAIFNYGKANINGGSYNALGTNGGAAIANYGKANINGGSFTSIGGYSLNNQAGASMTIAAGVTANNGIYISGADLVVNGGEIEGNRSGCHVLYSSNSNVTINGGSFYNNNSGNSTIMAAGTSEMTINGGTFGIKDGRVPGNGNTWTSCLTDTQNTAKLTVNGGTFNGGFRVQAGSAMTINGGTYNDVTGSSYNIYGTVVVNAGTFEDATAKNFADKYKAESSEFDANTGVVVQNVAKIGNTYYKTLQAAVNAVNEGETIYLISTVNEGSVKLPAVLKNITIDGNNTVVVKNTTINAFDGSSVDYQGFTVKNTTFENSRFNLSGYRSTAIYKDIVFNNNKFLNIVASQNMAAVHMNLRAGETLENFTFTNNIIDGVSGSSNSGIVIKQLYGDVVISNNTITDVAWNAIQCWYNNGANIAITNNTLSAGADEGVINLNGVDAVVLKNNTITTKKGQPELAYFGAVAKIGDVYYNTLADAIAAAANGDTVKLLADVMIEDVLIYADRNGSTWNGSCAFNFRIGKTMTLDLNGNTIKSTGGSDCQPYAIFCVDGKGNLTITDSSADNSGAIICDVTAPCKWQSAVIYSEAGDVTINGGTLSNVTDNDDLDAFAIDSVTAGDTSLTISGDAVLHSVKYPALVLRSQGGAGTQNVAISGGKIDGGAWVVLKNGVTDVMNLTVSGGTFSGEDAIIFSNYAAPAAGATEDTVEISGGVFEGTVAIGSTNVGNLLSDGFISGGIFSSNVSAYAAEGFDVVRTADGYVVEGEVAQADTLSVVYEDITEAGTEGEKTYAIVLKANGKDAINELASADLTFEYTTAPAVGGAIDFTVAPAEKFSMSRVDNTNRYMFNYDGVGAWEGTANAITIGTIKVVGYGTFTIATAGVTTNIVNATTVNDNLVDSYTVAGATDSDATTGALDISGKVDNGAIKVPTRELTINVTFPNAVEDNAIAYQDMKVEITGNIDGVNKTVTYKLGEGENAMVDGKYVVTNDDLVLNNAYTVTVSGAGYRTARYTVTMTNDKELNFWNNVMDEDKLVEKDKATSNAKVTFLAGDIVKDNNINIYDLSAVVSYFATSNETDKKSDYAKYDLNRDGVIDSKDVAYVLVSWGK